MPGQRFPTAGWGSSPPGGLEAGGEKNKGEYPGAELRNKSVHPWTKVASLIVLSLLSALKVAV